MVEQSKEIEKEFNYEEEEASVVREPIVDTKIWAPPSSPSYDNFLFEIDALESNIDKGLDSPLHDPTYEVMENLETHLLGDISFM